MKNLLARVWRALAGSMQWRILWFAHSKYMVGVTGIVRDEQGRVLLLRHRMWPQDCPWGLPTGYAVAGEDFTETVEREVHEETGLTVKAGSLARLTSGYRLRVEVAYEAMFVAGSLKIDSTEILEARWCFLTELPEGLQPTHRELILGP